MGSGQVIFESLQQLAGRRAILRDRDAFPVFVDAIRTVQPTVNAVITRVSREVDASTADRVADTLRKVFDKVLRELSDFDNPMRTPTGTDEGEGGLFARQQRPLKPPLPPPNPSGHDTTTRPTRPNSNMTARFGHRHQQHDQPAPTAVGPQTFPPSRRTQTPEQHAADSM